MLAIARIMFGLAIVAGVVAVATRFIAPTLLPAVLPVTMLKVVGLFFLGSIAASLLEIAEKK